MNLGRWTRSPAILGLLAALALQVSLVITGSLTARLLGAESRGFLALFAAITSVTAQVGGLGIALSVTYHIASRRATAPVVISTLRRPIIVQLVALVVIDLAAALAYAAGHRDSLFLVAAVSVGILPATMIMDYALATLLGLHQHVRVNLLRPLPSALYATFIVALAVSGGATLLTVVAANGIAATIAAGIAIYTAKRPTREASEDTSASPPSRGELLRFGRKGYVGYLAPLDTLRVDQFIVGLAVSPTALGYYAAASAFTNLPRFAAHYIGLSSTPQVARQADHGRRRQLMVRTVSATAGSMLVFSVLLAFAIPYLIPLLFGSSFRPAVPIAIWLLAAGWCLSVKRIAVDVLRGAGITKLGTRAEVVTTTCFAVGLLLGGANSGVAVSRTLAFASFAGLAAIFLILIPNVVRNRGV